MEAVILFSVLSIVGIIAIICIRIYDLRHKARQHQIISK